MPDGVPIQPKDSRGYFMLPQAPEDAGYYVYGTLHYVPETGAEAQYAHPYLLSMIFQIEREWQAICDRKFGIGNISVDGGKNSTSIRRTSEALRWTVGRCARII